MTTYPFVRYFMNPATGISSTPIMIFGNDKNTCLIDSILLSSVSDTPLKVSVNVAREEAGTAPGVEVYYSLASQVQITPYGRVDILENKAFTLEPGDLLYASCDWSGGLFDTFVIGQELTETGEF